MERENYIVKSFQELDNILQVNLGKDYFHHSGYQLNTNSGFVYELEDQRVIFIPSNFKYDGIIFRDKYSFQEIINKDEFPIENPHKNFLEEEKEKIFDLPNQIEFYLNFMKEILKYSFEDVNEISLITCLKKVVGRTIKNVVTGREMVGLIVILGEYLKSKFGGKWFLVKRYGLYNPIYEPHLLTKNDRVINVTSLVIGKLKWKITDINSILKSPLVNGFNGEGGIEFSKFRPGKNCILFEQDSR